MLNKIALLKFLSNVFWGLIGLGEMVALYSLLTLKRSTRTFDFQSNKPHPIQSLYNTFSIKKLCPKAPIKTLPPGLKGLCPPWGHCYMLFELFWTKRPSHDFDHIRLGKEFSAGGGGASCPPSFLNMKRELEVCSSNQMTLLKFRRPLLS